MTEFRAVYYPIHEFGDGLSPGVVVERLEEDQLTEDIAYSALRIMVSAYAAQFEGPGTVAELPAGSFENHFQPEDEAGVRRQMGRMALYMEYDSEYWFARSGSSAPDAQTREPSGLIKVSPSRRGADRLLKLTPPNMYINDIAVAAPMQGRGLGSDMMHAVLEHGGYREDAAVALDGYRANPRTNEWFESLDFKRNPKIRVAPLKLRTGEELSEVRLESKTVGAVVRRLHQKYRRLLDGVSIGS